MELYQIRNFAAVVETGSITKAAIRAAVSQPALSVSIAKLEDELGVRLFHRSPKSVTLTPAGRRFHATAQEVLRACNKVKAELRASVADRPLRIGILCTLPSTHVARLIETLQRELPDTRIELAEGTQEDLHAQLAARKLLACISAKAESEPGQRSVELLREDYGLVASLNHRFAFCESIELSDLNGEPFIVRTHCEAFDSTRKLLAERGIRSQVVYRTDQDDRALALVGAGLGVALMPAIFDAPNVKKVPIRDFHSKRVISLHWNEDVADDRLDQLVAFATTHNWAPSARPNLETLRGFSGHAGGAQFDRLGVPA
ncbi:MAG TPA: LysR family transcriptional regulator [Stellaceae bacterium]|nr:LysR family transcriptional regulator [Stellaceae bacterium]